MGAYRFGQIGLLDRRILSDLGSLDLPLPIRCGSIIAAGSGSDEGERRGVELTGES
jgi:hypothetical protein